jgi:hypothetical protein
MYSLIYFRLRVIFYVVGEVRIVYTLFVLEAKEEVDF